MSTMQNLDTVIKASNSSNTNNTCTANSPLPANTNSTSTANSPPLANGSNTQNLQDANPESFISTSDCSALSSPYLPTLTSMGLTSSNISFDIRCGTDYNDQDADFMTVAVFTFEDCIGACASYNEVRVL